MDTDTTLHAAGERGAPPPRVWGEILPLWAALLSLVAAAAILLVLSSATRQVRTEVAEVVEPARSHLYDIQRIMALEDAAQRGFLLTRSEHFREEYRDRRAEEDTAFRNLRPLANRMGPVTAARYDSLRELTVRWRSTAFDRDLLDAPPGSRAVERELAEQQVLYAHALRAAAHLEDAIRVAAITRRDRIVDMERTEVRLVFVLVLVALGCVLVIVRTSRHMRRLATRAQRLAGEARAQHRELERLAREKEVFIRGVTHDLKNPLGAVDAYAQLLELGVRGELTDDQREWVQRIRRATQETLATINDLLELARVEGGHLRMERRSADVWSIAADAAEDYRATFEARGHTLRVAAPTFLPAVPTDGGRVREILANLLSNANKYTPPGGTITVGAETRHGAHGGGEWVTLWVRDTGPGIPAGERERIFDEFHRVGGSAAGGNGVGLSISRRMARLLGGELTVESRPGDGSCFVLWLPVPAPATPVRDTALEVGGSG